MNRLDHLLWILAEECGEVAHRASKAARFGMCEVQPGQLTTNAERILGEWYHAIAAIEMLIDEGHLTLPSEPEVRAAIERKKLQVAQYFSYSALCGRVDGARWLQPATDTSETNDSAGAAP
ncbi:MAG: hypothetical protein J0H00_13715 [Burkholderiales bacterium]|nr:hypothetical protein [Burkholderiales bacterium]OJX09272.1 MAG: hypothetical protein BGO72_20600 [Burkholderiales bacterium 70-64]